MGKRNKTRKQNFQTSWSRPPRKQRLRLGFPDSSGFSAWRVGADTVQLGF